MTEITKYPQAAAEATLTHLRNAGARGVECIVLWLGKRDNSGWTVEEAYRPEQSARMDQFTIPAVAMQALYAHLKSHRRMLVAQVHSHPEFAFHSRADDVGAIVRHVGALSIVIPHFALRTTAESFVEDSAVFRLSPANHWDDVTFDKREFIRCF